jgi:hypothetical protein
MVSSENIRLTMGFLTRLCGNSHVTSYSKQTITVALTRTTKLVSRRGKSVLLLTGRTMLLHALNKWPDVITVLLWPYALKLAIDIHNATPGSSGLSPAEIFAGTKDRNRLADFHAFGCQVFVLEARLQAGHKIPMWEPRSRMAIYLECSPQHASNVPIVMNIKTGLVSPQYHVVFDDHFTTTQCLATNILPASWKTLFQERSKNVLADSPILRDSHVLGPEWESPVPTFPLSGTNVSSSEGEEHTFTWTILNPPLDGDHSDPISPAIQAETTPSDGESSHSQRENLLSLKVPRVWCRTLHLENLSALDGMVATPIILPSNIVSRPTLRRFLAIMLPLRLSARRLLLLSKKLLPVTILAAPHP